MADIKRPDMDSLAPEVRAYIEFLEARLRQQDRVSRRDTSQAGRHDDEPIGPPEPPTTINLITISSEGVAKRSPRHLYSRQHRGGMGVFDLECTGADVPALLTLADERDDLILFTDQGRAFRLPANRIQDSAVHARGSSMSAALGLNQGERVAVVLPDTGGNYIAALSRRGHVRWFAAHLFRRNLHPGSLLFDAAELGAPAAACWAANTDDLFIATHQGQGIRFSARQVPTRGCLGIRLDRDDTAVAITAVGPDSGVFLVSADGRGAVRTMCGFRANKAPGAGGKAALRTDHLIGAAAITQADDVFLLSRLGKVIRFAGEEIPQKDGMVQGVNCMSLRSDEVVACVISAGLRE
ncbi:MAG: hypothetical protein GX620_11685 [Chloroflexi bacterium]|nr:hypothetical protein [Chloroflexota bacterium]